MTSEGLFSTKKNEKRISSTEKFGQATSNLFGANTSIAAQNPFSTNINPLTQMTDTISSSMNLNNLIQESSKTSKQKEQAKVQQPKPTSTLFTTTTQKPSNYMSFNLNFNKPKDEQNDVKSDLFTSNNNPVIQNFIWNQSNQNSKINQEKKQISQESKHQSLFLTPIPFQSQIKQENIYGNTKSENHTPPNQGLFAKSNSYPFMQNEDNIKEQLVPSVINTPLLLPIEYPTINKLKSVIEEKGSIIYHPSDPIVKEQNIQIQQLQLKLKEIQKKKAQILAKKSKIEKQKQTILEKRNRQPPKLNIQPHLRPLTQTSNPSNAPYQSLNLTDFQNLSTMSRELSSLLERKSQIEKNKYKLNTINQQINATLKQRFEQETKRIIYSQQELLNQIRKTYEDQRHVYINTSKHKNNGKNLRSEISYSVFSQEMRMEMSPEARINRRSSAQRTQSTSISDIFVLSVAIISLLAIILINYFM